MNAGNPNPSPLHVPSKLRGHFTQLESLRESLLKGREPLCTVGSDTASDRLAHSISLGILAHQQDAVSEVEAAINRILTGRYGICEETGKPIPEARLKVVPWTRYTKEVLERKERRRIGELLSFASVVPSGRVAPQRNVFPVNARMAQA